MFETLEKFAQIPQELRDVILPPSYMAFVSAQLAETKAAAAALWEAHEREALKSVGSLCDAVASLEPGRGGLYEPEIDRHVRRVASHGYTPKNPVVINTSLIGPSDAVIALYAKLYRELDAARGISGHYQLMLKRAIQLLGLTAGDAELPVGASIRKGAQTCQAAICLSHTDLSGDNTRAGDKHIGVESCGVGVIIRAGIDLPPRHPARRSTIGRLIYFSKYRSTMWQPMYTIPLVAPVDMAYMVDGKLTEPRDAAVDPETSEQVWVVRKKMDEEITETYKDIPGVFWRIQGFQAPWSTT